ncbi:hypothetical protein B0T17DRAFT_490814 [Bombardia bombarda]|uniref:2EXR domain-containing protein n=1 Tax=Bombardia bombarda TaxID=252184 RepID=A0AA40C910_9PEZI|nr:hypothetical protein B0T17DRAFT_490814 [Bombardia bombarda]
MALEAFTLFDYLPAELRLEIWRHSCHARVVEVRYSQEQDRCLTTTKPPVVLHVCREARYEGLKLYVKAFMTPTHHDNPIYFSPTMDILYVPRCGNMGYGDTARDFGLYVRDTIEHIHSLAIDHVKPEIRRPWETYNKYCLLRNFPYLREAFLILALDPQDSEHPYRNGEIELVDPRGDQREVMRLMDNVRQSFTYEVGPACFGPPLGKSDGSDESFDPSLELVPKTITTHPWESRPAFVSCV